MTAFLDRGRKVSDSDALFLSLDAVVLLLFRRLYTTYEDEMGFCYIFLLHNFVEKVAYSLTFCHEKVLNLDDFVQHLVHQFFDKLLLCPLYFLIMQEFGGIT